MWQELRYFSEERMYEPYGDGRTRGIDGSAEWTRLEAEARKMIESGLELADRVEAAWDINRVPGSRFQDAGPTRFGSGVTPTFSTLPKV